MVGLGDSINRITEDDRLKGVRGLLLVPPVIVVLDILPTSIQLFRIVISSMITTPVGVVTAAISVVVIALGSISIWALTKEKRIARLLMVIFFVLAGVLSLIGFLKALDNPSTDPITLLRGFRDVVLAPIIIVYFFVSRRVKLTLVN